MFRVGSPKLTRIIGPTNKSDTVYFSGVNLSLVLRQCQAEYFFQPAAFGISD